jgi:signal transduction histidine kinase
LLGLIVVERRDSNEPLGEEHEQMIAELARQVGLALHNDKLGSELERSLEELRKQAEDLRASRERVVVAADAARRKIERDIHDGAQQHLVALRVKLRLAQGIAEADPAALQTMLGELSQDVLNAVEELRRLSHGVYPKVLTDHGLMPALDGIAATATLRTTVTGNGDRRYPQEVEAAVYFICREAMQNASKHAGEDAIATIRVWEESGALLFEFADNGAGFDARARGLGSGFTNMDDRLGAIGGTLTVESAPGAGCTIRGRVPL